MSERHNQSLRRSVAAHAARLMAEEGIDDFGFAKRKAARQLGFSNAEALPTNAEVEEELHSYVALFRDEEDEARLREMRLAAVDVMRLFAPFRPYLTGTVLAGTAGAFSEVELEIYADSAKDVEIFMINQNIRYEHREVRRSGPDAPEAILVFDWGEIPFRVNVYDHVSERSPRRTPGGSKLAERARLDAVEALIGNDLAEEE
ncbi:hypothetical protein ACDA63_09420 [Uliginosibacterium sp. sgz301328]|uniref:hypothetical protein n=1 Tax=Uliginosibacterium sp. sgz301328 TaxID=3243764 RepID=UPI00359D602A